MIELIVMVLAKQDSDMHACVKIVLQLVDLEPRIELIEDKEFN